MANTKHSAGLLYEYEIADCVRTVFRPRKIAALQQ